MAFFSTSAALLLALAQSTLASNSTCQSYGVDYQNGGDYFQNSNSNSTFTATQQFSGCLNDTAHNVIVDPNGDQSMCSSTNMTPSGQDMLVTCSNWTSSSMYSGDWSLLVVSNNGNGTPIAYQRDFSISVGTPVATVSAAPTSTVTVSETTTTTSTSTHMSAYTTTVVNTNSTTTSSGTAASGVVSNSANATSSGVASSTGSDSAATTAASAGASSTSGSATASDASAAAASTTASAGASSTVDSETAVGGTTTGSDGTATITSYYYVTDTVSASCSSSISSSSSGSAPATTSATATFSSPGFQPPQFSPDPRAKIAPTVLGKFLDELAESIIDTYEETFNKDFKRAPIPFPASAKFRKAIIEGRAIDAELKRAFVKERAAFLHGSNAIAKRHPDSETSTIFTGTTTYTSYTTETATETAYTTTTSVSTKVHLVGRDAATSTHWVPYTIYATPACSSSS